jgi:hypothetical protein
VTLATLCVSAAMSTTTTMSSKSDKSAKNQKRKQSRSKQSSKPKQDPLHPDVRLLLRGGLITEAEAHSTGGSPPVAGALLQKVFLQVCHKGHEPEQAATVLHAMWEAGIAYDNADAVIEQLALQREVADKRPPSTSPPATVETATAAATATTAVSDEPEATHPAVEAINDAQVSPRNSCATAAAAAPDAVAEEPSMAFRLETAGAHPIVADALMSITQWAASQSQQQLAVLFECKALDRLFQVCMHTHLLVYISLQLHSNSVPAMLPRTKINARCIYVWCMVCSYAHYRTYWSTHRTSTA